MEGRQLDLILFMDCLLYLLPSSPLSIQSQQI